ncbi:MAG: LysM peptidoglycan-binding domain-containing protein [Acidobacteria bacterium]|nr:LysM peptidoglycan-binding domain-containing protein [Acidobacteriota bacterium]
MSPEGRSTLTLLLLAPILAAILACATTGAVQPGASSLPEDDPRPSASEEPPSQGEPPVTSAEMSSGPGPRGESVVPEARETIPDRQRDAAPEVQRVRQQMEEAYQAGLEAYQAGRFEEAREHFDRAVDVVVSSDLDLDEHPALRKTFDEIVRNIADLDADLYSREGEQETGDNESPLDRLRDITTHLPPDEAEKEREKIQQVVGKISYDIPIALNAKVLQFVEAFQTRLREEFEAGLKRSGMYLPMIKRIFRDEGLPEDLAYMAHQESAFKTNAYSRARARGIWQFMSFTGRKYGLKRDLWKDERSDFEKATRAAAAYLKDLYARYNDWYLAMAAYNAGEGKIDRAVARARTRDYWALARTRYIRPETKYYVPAILASILIDKSPEDYGFDVEPEEELTWDTVTIDKATDLQVIADAAGTTIERIRLLNPELHGLITPPNIGSYRLRVPEGTERNVLAHLEALPDDRRVSWTLHEVRPGETFSHIARKHSVPVRALLDANPRYAGKRLRRGNIINVPLVKGTPALALARASQNPTYEGGERIVHRVHRGESLQTIARMYRTTVANLKRWNRLDGSLIRPGQRLVLYYGEKGDGPGSEAASEGVSGQSGGASAIRHRVRRGETLLRIARKYDVSVGEVRAWNRLGRTSLIYPGQVLTIFGN